MFSTIRSCTISRLLAAFLFLLAASPSAFAQPAPASAATSRSASPSSQGAARSVAQISQDFGKLVSAISPSVVQVLATGYGSAPEGGGAVG
ncbi:MAG: hypothetical protein ACRD2X_13630, partial [Vicinamibacteraceae bacterium]